MVRSEALLDLLDRASCGGILLNEERVVGFNETAHVCLQELCRADAGLVRGEEWARDLLRQLERNSSYRRGLSDPNRAISRRKGRAFVARVCSFPWSEDGGPKPLLILVDLDRSTEAGEPLLRQIFGLTGAEAKLAARMTGGRGLEEVAGMLRISMSTVRSQLQAIFAKTRTHRQGELVALLNRAGLLRVDGQFSGAADLRRLQRNEP